MQLFPAIDSSITYLLVLILARVGAIMMSSPIYGERLLPIRFRLLLAFCVAVLVFPIELGTPVEVPGSMPMLVVAVVAEILIGLTLGLGIRLFFSAMQMAGELIGRMGGVMVADVFDPTSGESAPLMSRLYYLFAITVFLLIGGHRLIMSALLETYKILPPGSSVDMQSAGNLMVGLADSSFQLGFHVALPVACSLLIATIAVALIGRTLPQLNIMTVGFSLNAILTFGLVFVSIGTAAWLFADQMTPVLEQILESFTNSGT